MAVDITSMFASQNNIEYLVQQYMTLETGPRDRLVDERNVLESRKTALSDLDSKFSALSTQLERLTDPITDYFAAKLGTTSDSEKFTISAGTSAGLGTHSISAERLSSADTRVSQQYASDSSDFTGITTNQSFIIQVYNEEDEETKDITVSIDASVFTGTNEEVLDSIEDAIDTAMSNAVTNDIIDSDEVVRASVTSEESDTSRLVLRSEQSGFTYAMNFTDTDGLLATLQVNSASEANTSGNNGGWITQVGTSASDSLLNSKFEVDGLTYYRDTNNVTDAVTGVTISLLDTFATSETMTITADTEGVKEEINTFISAYNELLDYLESTTQIDPDTYERGALADDMIYRNIAMDIRGIVVDEVTDTDSEIYERLYSIGIEPDDDGRLSIDDTEKFTNALESNATNVSDIFNGTDGIATRMFNYIENYIEVGGAIDTSQENADTFITSLNDRIAFQEELLGKREEQLRTEFSRLQEMMYELSSQQSFYSSFFSG